HAIGRQRRADGLVGADSGTDGGAVVGGRGLDEDVVDHAGGQQPTVGFGIHRHAASQAHVAAASQSNALADQLKDRALQLVLDGRGQVAHLFGDLDLGVPLGTVLGDHAREVVEPRATDEVGVELVTAGDDLQGVV